MDPMTTPEAQAVWCDQCQTIMKLGEPFPCHSQYSSNAELQAGCSVMGKPWASYESLKELHRPDGIAWLPGPEVVPLQWLTPSEPVVKKKTSGGSTSYYKIPDGAKDLQDLIEFKQMTFGRGNVFKAMYRLGEKDVATEEYDLEKSVFFAIRELNFLRVSQGLPPHPMPDWLENPKG